MTGMPAADKRRRKAQRVVAADRDEASDAEPLQIFQHDRREVVVLAVKRKLLDAIRD